MAAQMGECRGGGDGGLIKLFGKTIPVREAGDVIKDLQQSGSSSTESNVEENATDSSPQPEVVDAEDPAAADKSSPRQSDDDVADVEKEKLKKPDKILPCPRCNSMETKFCYFNNYNVNQPRHFCKNCQRYWTAGGAMRNVPVGAGRRKNKNAIAASHFLQRVQAALPGDTLCSGPPVKTNGTVLSFSNDASTTLDLAEQMPHLRENLMPISLPGNTCDNPSMGSCSEVSSNIHDHNPSNSRDKVTVEKSAHGVQQQGMNRGTMWPYGCAPPPAAYYTSGIAIPIYPGAPGYWGCMVPRAWSLPWPVQCQSQALSSPTSAPSVSSGPRSFTLGKHPREVDEGRSHGNGKVWVPKTIRIDNADEVARSSIQSLFGIKRDDREEADTSSQKLATVFEPKQSELKMAKHAVSLPLLHHANPVALKRSVTFHEGS